MTFIAKAFLVSGSLISTIRCMMAILLTTTGYQRVARIEIIYRNYFIIIVGIGSLKNSGTDFKLIALIFIIIWWKSIRFISALRFLVCLVKVKLRS
jgi:hypothetical protein